MKRSLLRVLALFAAVLFVAGCARSVDIIKPVDNSAQQDPVQFEVKLRDPSSTFNAYLEGPGFPRQEITGSFTISGDRATASSAAANFPTLDCQTRYTFRAVSRLQPQSWQVRDNDDEVEFVFEPGGPPLSLSPPSVEFKARPNTQDGLFPGQIYSETLTVSIPAPLANDLTVTLHRSNPFIVLSAYQAPNIASVNILAGQTSANHNWIWFLNQGTGTVSATAPCYSDAVIPVKGLP